METDEDSAVEDDHQELLDKVCSISKRRRPKQRTEGGVVASEFHLPPTSQDGKVSIAGLLKGLGATQDKSLMDLSKKLSNMEDKTKPMDTPLNKIQADRANREAANKLTCKEVGKWDPIVKKNREAEHLTFPLQPDHVPPPSLATKLETFQPCTELEKEVAAILSRSENVESEDQELTEAERKSLFQMSKEEAMERKRELQKHRALMSVYEQKCKRIRRIKSKRFHKVRRKHLEKIGDKAECTDEDLIKLRAKERMTLKHSSKAKWARKQHSREHRDPGTQQALTEHHQRKVQLKEKLPAVLEDDEEDNEETQLKGGEEIEHENIDGLMERQVVFADSNNPWLSSLTKGQSNQEDSSDLFSTSKTIATSSFLGSGVDGGRSGKKGEMAVQDKACGEGDGGGGGGLGHASKQLLSIREAFAGDDVVEEFEKEKEELERQAMESDVPAVLPGWGSWGGLGVKARKKCTKEPHKLPASQAKKPRKDAGMKHVIISESQVNRKLKKHLVQSVPWPYTSKEQFDKTHCMPVGRQWNTEATYQRMIRPRVTTKAGEIIKPLVLTEDVQEYMDRTQAKKKPKKRTKRTKNS